MRAALYPASGQSPLRLPVWSLTSTASGGPGAWAHRCAPRREQDPRSSDRCTIRRAARRDAGSWRSRSRCCGWCGSGGLRWSAPALGSHADFVPQIDLVAVGVGQLGAVSPPQLLRGIDEPDALAHQFAMFPINILDLNDQGAFCSCNLVRNLVQENRESRLILDRDGFGLGIFELDLEPQSFQIPIARPFAVRDRQGQVIEFQQGGSWFLRTAHSLRLN